MLTLIAHFDLNLRYIFFTPMQRQCEIRKFAPRTNKMTSPARKLTYSPSSGPGQEEKGYQLQQDCMRWKAGAGTSIGWLTWSIPHQRCLLQKYNSDHRGHHTSFENAPKEGGLTLCDRTSCCLNTSRSVEEAATIPGLHQTASLP